MEREIELLVLAGGFGTRLRSAVADVPKSLAPVAGNPYLEYLIELWVKQGVTKLTFLLHHQANLIQDFLGSPSVQQRLQGCRLRTLIEPEPFGTGGAVAFAVSQFQLKGSFLVANADTWLGTGILKMSSSKAPSLAVVQMQDTTRYGSILVKQGRVTEFLEKREGAGAGWINAGLYHLPAELVSRWDGKPISLERDIFPRAAETGKLHTVALKTDFIDIGVPSDYFRFCRWIESGKIGTL